MGRQGGNWQVKLQQEARVQDTDGATGCEGRRASPLQGWEPGVEEG